MSGECRRGVESIVLSYERLIALVQRAVETPTNSRFRKRKPSLDAASHPTRKQL